MAGIFAFVFFVTASKCLSAVGEESLPSNEAFSDTNHFESTAKNCSSPKPIVSGSVLKWRPGVYDNQSVFLPGEKAEFVCKEGFRQIGFLQTLTCQKDGTWGPSSSNFGEDFEARAFGYCITKNCSDGQKFNCTSHNEQVPICKKCDCIADCRDGSDEMNCGPLLINVTGRATGSINSPRNHNNIYTGPLNCSKTLWTDDLDFYIKLLFTNFSMSGDCSGNYVFLENATLSDSTPSCCEVNKDIPCAFGEKTGPPPLSHTNKNFMIVNFVSKESTSSSFSAKWYNVNGFYPYGSIPKEDSKYPDKIIFASSSGLTTVDEPTDSTYIAAVVIFSIIAFIVVAVVGCKIGQHFLGPRCSIGYCCAWIAARRSQRSPRLSPRREPSPEARPIRGDINEPTRRGVQRTVPVDARATTAQRTRYGSAENA